MIQSSLTPMMMVPPWSSPWEPCHRQDFSKFKLSQSLPAVGYVVGIYTFRPCSSYVLLICGWAKFRVRDTWNKSNCYEHVDKSWESRVCDMLQTNRRILIPWSNTEVDSYSGYLVFLSKKTCLTSTSYSTCFLRVVCCFRKATRWAPTSYKWGYNPET